MAFSFIPTLAAVALILYLVSATVGWLVLMRLSFVLFIVLTLLSFILGISALRTKDVQKQRQAKRYLVTGGVLVVVFVLSFAFIQFLVTIGK